MKYGIETITPDIAAELLKGNVNNRSKAVRHVRFLADQMTEGKWKDSGDPIRIAKNGRILDGQHRLSAIIDSGVSLNMLVIRDMEEEVFDVIDTGKTRSAADVLTIKSIPNASQIAALSKKIILYSRGVYSARTTLRTGVSNADILSYVNENIDRLLELIRMAYTRNTSFKYIKVTEYALMQSIFDEISQEDSHAFLTKLSQGTGLDLMDPILLLRNKILDDTSATTHLLEKWRLSLFIRTWNHFRQGNKLKILQVNTQGDFPIPI